MPLPPAASGAVTPGCVAYATFTTPLGVLLVASTARGLCDVALGDAARPLEQSLRETLTHASLVEDAAAVAAAAGRLVRYLGGEIGAAALGALPLDLQGTDFQRQVWAALRDIPPGETRSYAAVAGALGRPTAARAVARACGANRVALAVPCHRVVGTDGRLRGYRWGEARKRHLLAMEAAACAATWPPPPRQPGYRL